MTAADDAVHSGEKVTDGLRQKYQVTRLDGRDMAGERHQGCRYFVLDPQHDTHAVTALRAYATAVGGKLSQDIAAWLQALDYCPDCTQVRGHRGRCEPRLRPGSEADDVHHSNRPGSK